MVAKLLTLQYIYIYMVLSEKHTGTQTAKFDPRTLSRKCSRVKRPTGPTEPPRRHVLFSHVLFLAHLRETSSGHSSMTKFEWAFAPCCLGLWSWGQNYGAGFWSVFPRFFEIILGKSPPKQDFFWAKPPKQNFCQGFLEVWFQPPF